MWTAAHKAFFIHMWACTQEQHWLPITRDPSLYSFIRLQTLGHPPCIGSQVANSEHTELLVTWEIQKWGLQISQETAHSLLDFFPSHPLLSYELPFCRADFPPAKDNCQEGMGDSLSSKAAFQRVGARTKLVRAPTEPLFPWVPSAMPTSNSLELIARGRGNWRLVWALNMEGGENRWSHPAPGTLGHHDTPGITWALGTVVLWWLSEPPFPSLQ